MEAKVEENMWLLTEQYTIKNAMGDFNQAMHHSPLSLERLHSFHDENEVKAVAQTKKIKIMEKFKARNSQLTEEKIEELDGKLEIQMDEYVMKNSSHRIQTESFMETFTDFLCEDFRTSVEALIKLEPNMKLESLQDVMGSERWLSMTYFMSHWKPGNKEFHNEQKSRFEEKLSVQQEEIYERQRSFLEKRKPSVDGIQVFENMKGIILEKARQLKCFVSKLKGSEVDKNTLIKEAGEMYDYLTKKGSVLNEDFGTLHSKLEMTVVASIGALDADAVKEICPELCKRYKQKQASHSPSISLEHAISWAENLAELLQKCFCDSKDITEDEGKESSLAMDERPDLGSIIFTLRDSGMSMGTEINGKIHVLKNWSGELKTPLFVGVNEMNNLVCGLDALECKERWWIPNLFGMKSENSEKEEIAKVTESGDCDSEEASKSENESDVNSDKEEKSESESEDADSDNEENANESESDDSANSEFELEKKPEKVTFKLDGHEISQDISIEFFLGLLLKSLKENAERQLQGRFSKAIITVPCWLPSSYRIQVKASARVAGFPSSLLVNEETAAAYAYPLEELPKEPYKYARDVVDGKEYSHFPLRDRVLILSENFGIISSLERNRYRDNENDSGFKWNSIELLKSDLRTDVEESIGEPVREIHYWIRGGGCLGGGRGTETYFYIKKILLIDSEWGRACQDVIRKIGLEIKGFDSTTSVMSGALHHYRMLEEGQHFPPGSFDLVCNVFVTTSTDSKKDTVSPEMEKLCFSIPISRSLLEKDKVRYDPARRIIKNKSDLDEKEDSLKIKWMTLWQNNILNDGRAGIGQFKFAEKLLRLWPVLKVANFEFNPESIIVFKGLACSHKLSGSTLFTNPRKVGWITGDLEENQRAYLSQLTSAIVSNVEGTMPVLHITNASQSSSADLTAQPPIRLESRKRKRVETLPVPTSSQSSIERLRKRKQNPSASTRK